ncbi:MAG TPA: PH domain-containing protein [Candidatus Sulfotelmatobacter sp.]|jgi:uncharacterized membrane protein YdbT with pleckstrin-like domain|nr:PH domain-containing protein [Candidatus Sulfotelmatobacter sp.]
MSYVEKHLMEGEQVAYTTRLHWIVLVGPLVLCALFAVPGVALLVASANRSSDPHASAQSMLIAGAALLVIALVILIRGIVTRNAVQMAVTNKRVIAKVGVTTRRTVDLLLSRVESVGVEESVMGRMLGYGTVTLRGTGGTPESFNKIAHPLEFRTQVQQQIDGMQTKA